MTTPRGPLEVIQFNVLIAERDAALKRAEKAEAELAKRLENDDAHWKAGHRVGRLEAEAQVAVMREKLEWAKDEFWNRANHGCGEVVAMTVAAFDRHIDDALSLPVSPLGEAVQVAMEVIEQIDDDRGLSSFMRDRVASVRARLDAAMGKK